MEERRIKPRWQINQAAELAFENGIKTIPCLVEDINQLGCRLNLKRNLFDEVFSNFKLILSQEIELNLNAMVVWREEQFERNIYGLSFSGMADSGREELDRYIKDNFSKLIVQHWWEEPQNA